VANSLIDEEAIWVEFAKAMAPMAYTTSQALAKVLNAEGPANAVLDIAASHGYFGIAVALLNPKAQVTALDSASVLEVARENAGRMGVSARHRLLPGNAFKSDLGSGYDLALVTNFVHAFDREVNIGLLKRIHAALVPGGRIALAEMVPNEDRVSPPPQATFALSMLVGTHGGDAYTFSELKEMLEAAGFKDARMERLDPVPQRAVIARA
jgi:ubiquinone/menaquinone biosynthesis C-methylase UbiE